jgi:hypothetical protein
MANWRSRKWWAISTTVERHGRSARQRGISPRQSCSELRVVDAGHFIWEDALTNTQRS